jgi:hypothetical protein
VGLVQAYVVNSSGDNNNPLVTPAFTPVAGERIVITIVTDDFDCNISGISGSANGLTYTSRYSHSATEELGSAYLWTTVVTGTPASMTITATCSGATGRRQMVVSRWSDVTIAASPAVGFARESTTTSASITTTGTNSIVVWASGDWDATNPGTPTYRSGAIPLGSVYYVSEELTAYSGYQVAATPGAKTFGISSPSGQWSHLVGIELLAAATSAAALSGSGSLLAEPSIPNIVASVMQGTGKLTAVATKVRFAAASLVGTGDLDTSGYGEKAAAATLASTGSLIAAATPARLATAALAGVGSLVVGAGSAAFTGPANSPENFVGYFALRDLGLATGDTTYTAAAAALKTSLLRDHWVTEAPRATRGVGDTAGSLHAQVLAGLFLLAVGERGRARDVVRHLRHYRVKDAEVDAFHVEGPDRLIGYRPVGDAYLSPSQSGDGPEVIDQAGSWLAVLFKYRFGEPVGDDVRSLQKWRYNDDDSSYLYGAQWLNYSTDSEVGDAVAVRARPYLGSAAWAYLLSTGAQDLLAPDPLPAPDPSGLTLASRYDYQARRVVLTGGFSRNSAVACAAYEASLEFSINNGSTWANVSGSTQRDSIERARSGAGYKLEWRFRMPSNTATRYRMKLRLRNASFGSWVTSSAVTLPSI